MRWRSRLPGRAGAHAGLSRSARAFRLRRNGAARRSRLGASARSDLAGGFTQRGPLGGARTIQVSAATGAGQKLRSRRSYSFLAHRARRADRVAAGASRPQGVIGRDGALAVQRKRHYTLATLVWREAPKSA